MNTTDDQNEIADKKAALFLEVCIGPSCSKFCPEDIFQAFKKLATTEENARVVKTGCTGNCDFSPNIKINGQVRRQVALDEIKSIFTQALENLSKNKGDIPC